MRITYNRIQTAQIKSVKKWLLLFTVSLLPLTPVMASDINSKQYSVSHGALKKDINEQQRKNIIEINKLTEQADQLTGKATAKTREETLKNQQKMFKQLTSNSVTTNNSHTNPTQYHDAEFAIYSATSLLQEDYDGDGYYQTFSIIFDADIYSYTNNQFGEVYGLLYLSKNGGPWTHYFTTDTFLIEGDTDDDEYEVITTFLSGYSSDEYDVLIDLYQVGYSDIVASYSSDDNNALYALPLESADYDEVYVEPYIEVVEVHGGGSMSMLIVLLLGIFSIRINSRRC